MYIKLYQIDLNADKKGVAFEGWETTMELAGKICSNIYKKVFEGATECKTLEDIYRIFNIDQPEGYAGRSMSVSDIVEVVSSTETKPGFYFCDSVGFHDLAAGEFVPEEAEELPKTRRIAVVLVEPGKEARVEEIPASLQSFRKVVGGDIEAYYCFEDEVCIVCNDEGKINGSPLSRAVYDKDGNIMDIIGGTFFVADCSGEEFGGLSKEDQDKYLEMFRYPEKFFRKDDKIVAEKIK